MLDNKLLIVRFAIMLVYYCIGAYGTTDIIRLKEGAQVSVSDKEAYCPSCGHKLALHEQIPIFAYIVHRGKCRYCHAPIPPEHEVIEVLIFVMMSAITLISGFSWAGCFLCILFYEGLKILYLCKYGRKKTDFEIELARSIRSNIIIFALYILIYSMQALAV